MIKKLSINRNKNIYGKKSNKKGGRPGAAAANAPDEEADPKIYELRRLKEQAEIAAGKPLPTNIDGTEKEIVCQVCLNPIEFINSPFYLEDGTDTKEVDEADPSNPERLITTLRQFNYKRNDPKMPHFIMRCPLGEHFYCSECFEKSVKDQIEVGLKRPQDFLKDMPFYIRCGSLCDGLYSNGQIKRLVSEKTYDRLVRVIKILESIKTDDVCNLTSSDISTKIFTCPRCFFGPQEKQNCFDMFAHHGEAKGPIFRLSNACNRCGFITPTDYDFIKFKSGEQNCNMCINLIEDTKEEEGFVGDTYYTKRAIAEFDIYFNWPVYIEPILRDKIWDAPRKKYILDLFYDRDTKYKYITDELIKTLSREKFNIENPELIYKNMVNTAIRCSRARNSLIIFLIEKCGDGQSQLFTRDKVMKYLFDKEPKASYLAPSIIAISAASIIAFTRAEFLLLPPLHEGKEDNDPFRSIDANSSELSLSQYVDVGIFALAHYLADPDSAVENYLKSADAPANEYVFATYNEKKKQEIIREIVKGAIDEITKKTIKTDEQIQALETATKQEEEAQEEFARTNKIITINKEKTIDLCGKKILAAEAKVLSHRVKSLRKVLEAINTSDPKNKVRLGREAYTHAFNAYEMHQKKVFNEFYIEALDIEVEVKTFPTIIWYKERLKDSKKKGEADSKKKGEADSKKKGEADSKKEGEADTKKKGEADTKKKVDADTKREAQLAIKDVNKVLGDFPFVLTTPESNSAGAFTYISDKPNVATVDRQTGLVTITGIGTTIITAIQAAHGKYEPYFNEAELKVWGSASELAATELAATEDDAEA